MYSLGISGSVNNQGASRLGEGCAGASEFLRRKPLETKTQSARRVYAYGEEINSRHEAAWQADGTYL